MLSSVPEPLRAPYLAVLIGVVGCFFLGVLNLFTHALGGGGITVLLLVTPFVMLITLRQLAAVVRRGIAEGNSDDGPPRSSAENGA